MARRLGKRKAPLREKHMMHEQNKVDTGIFDDKTMISLSKFYNKGVIEKLEFLTARGKEADVYLASPGNSDLVKGMDLVVVKFFRVETTSFHTMIEYMVGDPRFTKKISRKKKLGIVEVWCRKEFGNLEIAAKAGVLAPKPIMANGSILAMEFIGNGNVPAPQLKNVELSDPGKTLSTILDSMKRLYGRRLVHADVSEYNILIKGEDEMPYLIDFGQAVSTDHPNADMFLKRDVRNMVDYFAKHYGTKVVLEDAINAVIS